MNFNTTIIPTSQQEISTSSPLHEYPLKRFRNEEREVETVAIGRFGALSIPPLQPVNNVKRVRESKSAITLLKEHFQKKYPSFIEKHLDLLDAKLIEDIEKEFPENPIFFAVKNRDPILITLLTKVGGSPIILSRSGRTPTQVVLEMKDIEEADRESLLNALWPVSIFSGSRKILPFEVDAVWKSPLKKQELYIQFLMEKGLDLAEHRDSRGRSLFQRAIDHGNTDLAETLFLEHADPDHNELWALYDGSGKVIEKLTPILYIKKVLPLKKIPEEKINSVLEGLHETYFTQKVLYHIEKEYKNPTSLDWKIFEYTSIEELEEVSNPLHFAILHRDAELTKMLLIAGADINKYNDEDRTPLDLIFDLKFLTPKNRLDLLHAFLESGTSLEELADALWGRRHNKELEILQFLLCRRLSPSYTDSNGRSLLQKAVDRENAEAVALLLEQGGTSREDALWVTHGGEKLPPLEYVKKRREERASSPFFHNIEKMFDNLSEWLDEQKKSKEQRFSKLQASVLPAQKSGGE